MTLLVASISSVTVDEARRDIETALERGAKAIELRLDLMEEVSNDDVRTLYHAFHQEAPFILTTRSATEGGRHTDSSQARVDRLVELRPYAEYIDLELATWQASPTIQKQLKTALEQANEQTDDAPSSKLILSRHDLKSRPTSLLTDILAIQSEPACHAPKLAWRARSIRDNFEAFELMRDAVRPIIAICMGEDGILSRVLAKKYGAFATFAAPSPEAATAIGQLTLAEMKHAYRWDTINEKTQVYGVIGDPVAHSLSPRIHNRAFQKLDLNAVYLPMRVTSTYEAFKAFMVEVLARPWLDFRGFSVTLPHKENAIRFLKENNGKIDEVAARIGATNTLVLGTDGSLTGHNTDAPAALAAIRRGLGVAADESLAISTMVLGAGGVARAVVAGLSETGAKITICNRTEATAEKLAKEFGCSAAPWDARTEIAADLLVNCTSVGMCPDMEASPMPTECLGQFQTVFDTIYNPLQTLLLRESAALGCRTIDGLGMFASQATAQLRLWTGHSIATDLIEDAAKTAIQPPNA